MKINRIIQLIVSILIILLVGCSKPTPTPTPEEISDSLVIKYQTGPEIQTYGYVEALVKNTTFYCIIFPTDLGIKLFVDQDGSVSEIHNYTKYIGDQPRYLKQIGDIDEFISVGFDPDVLNLTITEQTKFYAEITGYLCDDASVVIKKKIPFVVVP